MKFRYYTLLLCVLLLGLAACQKEQLDLTQQGQISFFETEIDTRGKKDKNKVLVCHKTGDGNYHTIEVHEKAVPAHLKHGDFLFIDNDGDGFAQENPCVEIADCNDSDPVLNIGNACENEECNFCFFINDIDWLFYFNINYPDGTIVTAMFTGNPFEGGLGIQVEYNFNIPNQWASLYWNADFPSGTGELITEEEAIICRNAIAKLQLIKG